MKTHLVIAVAGSIAAIAAAPASAQQSRLATLELAPYAGFMLSSTLVDGPLGAGIASAGRALYGVQVGVPLTSHITLVGNVAHAQGDLELGLPVLGGIPFGRSATWLADAGVQLGLPIDGGRAQAVTPFVQLGAGAMRQSLTVSAVTLRATNFALNAGAGVDLSLSRNIGVRLLAKDYIGTFDFEEATSVDLDRGSAHNWALSAGVRLAF